MLNKQEFQVRYVQTSAAGVAPDAFIFVNPVGSGEYYQVIEAVGLWDVVGGSGAQADVKIVPSGTALASGTTCLGSVFDLTTGARTAVKKALAAAKVIAPGSALAVDTGGTLTGLAGLVIQVVLKPIRGSRRY